MNLSPPHTVRLHDTFRFHESLSPSYSPASRHLPKTEVSVEATPNTPLDTSICIVFGSNQAVVIIIIIILFFLNMQIIKNPADDVGALDAFISIVTGPPGPNPVSLIPKVTVPILLFWGDKDPFTPIDGPVGKYFASLPSQLSNVSLYLLEGVGHCPHDDRPELVHEKLLPWLAALPAL